MNFFSDLDAWQDYNQSPHTNQLRQLSESMDYTPRNMHFPTQRNQNLPNINSLSNYQTDDTRPSPRVRQIRTKRTSIVEQLYFKNETPLRERKKTKTSAIPQTKLNITTHEHKFNLITECREYNVKPLIPKNQIQKLAPILQQQNVHKVTIRNRVITLTNKTPFNQLSQLMHLIKQK